MRSGQSYVVGSLTRPVREPVSMVNCNLSAWADGQLRTGQSVFVGSLTRPVL